MSIPATLTDEDYLAIISAQSEHCPRVIRAQDQLSAIPGNILPDRELSRITYTNAIDNIGQGLSAIADTLVDHLPGVDDTQSGLAVALELCNQYRER